MKSARETGRFSEKRILNPLMDALDVATPLLELPHENCGGYGFSRGQCPQEYPLEGKAPFVADISPAYANVSITREFDVFTEPVRMNNEECRANQDQFNDGLAQRALFEEVMK